MPGCARLRLALLGLAGLAALGQVPCPAAAQVVSTEDFLKSLGVCVHISQGIDRPADVARELAYCGLREFRDDGSTSPAILQGFIGIHRTTGARVCLLPVGSDIPKTLAEYDTLAPSGTLLAAEGPNEPNNAAVTFDGATSSRSTALPTARFQAALYRAVKSDARLAGLPVFSASEGGGSEPDNVGLQYLKIPTDSGVTLMPIGTVYGDYANTHNYVCAHLPGLMLDNIAWQAEDPTLKSAWDGLYGEYGHTWYSPGYAGYSTARLERLPRVTTETGWVTQGVNALSEDRQGRLLLDLYLDACKRGWSYTFIYMLRDDPAQGSWGLFHNDNSPKLSATYLHHLTTILSGKSGTGHSSAPAYSIPGEPPTVHDLLLKKGDGAFVLTLWDERAGGADDVTVRFPHALAEVNIYDPTAESTRQKSLHAVASVPLELSDHPLLLEIPPRP